MLQISPAHRCVARISLPQLLSCVGSRRCAPPATVRVQTDQATTGNVHRMIPHGFPNSIIKQLLLCRRNTPAKLASRRNHHGPMQRRGTSLDVATFPCQDVCEGMCLLAEFSSPNSVQLMLITALEIMRAMSERASCQTCTCKAVPTVDMSFPENFCSRHHTLWDEVVVCPNKSETSNAHPRKAGSARVDPQLYTTEDLSQYLTYVQGSIS